MKILFYKTFSVLNLIAVLFFLSCSEDVTPSLYDLANVSLPTPIINSINPQNEALAGVTILTITGSNFSSVKERNLIYFNGKPGQVLSATPTELKVVSAVVIADTVLIKIAVLGSDKFSNVIQYKLKPAVEEFYPFDPVTKKEVPYAITTDNLDNIYVSLFNLGTKKISNQGVLTNFSPKGPETFFRSLALASDNAIYAVRGGIRGAYRLVENTAPVAFVSSANGIVDNLNSIVFDKVRNVLWSGGSTGVIHRIRLDKNVKTFSVNGAVNAMKIAGNTLYIATTATDKELIWKMNIVSADSLGTPELYFDLSTQIDNLLKVADIAIAQDGDLYIGTNKISDAVYVIHPDKSFEVLYPGLINSSTYSFVWGNGNFLYMSNIVSNINKTILKIDLEKLGAP